MKRFTRYAQPTKLPSDFFDIDPFGPYVSLTGVDTTLPTINTDSFNEWVTQKLNRTLRNIVQRMDMLEDIVNRAAVAQRGYIQAFFEHRSNPVYREDFQYSRVIDHVYDKVFDASGKRYEWEGKFASPPVLFPLFKSYLAGGEYAVAVYKNGRPFNKKHYSLHSQAGIHSLFVNIDSVKDFDKITVEFYKFWDTVGKSFIHSLSDNSNHINILFPADSVGVIHNAHPERVSDLIVYAKPPLSSQYTLVDPYRVSVFLSPDGSFVNLTINKYHVQNTEFLILNNAAGWEINYSRPMWYNSVRLIEDTLLENGSTVPLPVTDPNELLVLVYDVGNNMSFKLTPYVDYYIENGPPYMLKLKRMVSPFTEVHIIKRHPDSWVTNRRYLKKAPTDGVILMDTFEAPINLNCMDVTINNQHVHRDNLEQLTDFCFRIKQFSSNEDVYCSMSVMATDSVETLIRNYSDFRPSLEQYLQIEYDETIFNKLASGEPDVNTPTADTLYAETVTANQFVHLKLGESPPANTFYRENLVTSRLQVEPPVTGFNVSAPGNDVLQGSTKICFAPVICFRNLSISEDPPAGYQIPEIDQDNILIASIEPNTLISSHLENVSRSTEDGTLSKFFTFELSGSQHIRITMSSMNFVTRIRLRQNNKNGTILAESTAENIEISLNPGTYCIEATHDHSLL